MALAPACSGWGPSTGLVSLSWISGFRRIVVLAAYSRQLLVDMTPQRLQYD